MSARLGQVQTSPWLSANMTNPSIALSKKSSSSAHTSLKKTLGDLPPSSSVTGIRFCEAYCMMSLPVVVSPVNAILAIRLLEARGLPASRPKPLTTFDDALRQEIADQLHQHHDRGRCLLGGFEDDAVASRQRGRELPNGHQDREVPGNDLADHSERLVEVIRDSVLVDFAERPFLCADRASEIAEMIDRKRKIGGHR